MAKDAFAKLEVDSIKPGPTTTGIIAPSYDDYYDIGLSLRPAIATRYDEIERLFLTRASSYFQKPYGLYEEAVLKDPHLSGVLSVRTSSVLTLPRTMQEHEIGNSVSDSVKRFIQDVINEIGSEYPADQGFEADLEGILRSVGYGMAILEKIVAYRDGSWVITAMRERHPRRFSFNAEENTLRLLTIDDPWEGRPVPMDKFVYAAPYGEFENPFGWSHIAGVYFPVWIKKHCLKWWSAYIEKLASPPIMAKYPPGTDQATIDRLYDIVDSLKNHSAGAIEQGNEIEALDLNMKSSGQTYRELFEVCNSEISKGILGQTSTTEQSSTSRSTYGQPGVHNSVRKDITRRDAHTLMTIINKQVIKQLVDWNFPIEQRFYPKWQLELKEEADLNLEMYVDTSLQKLGVNLSKNELLERYKRREARDASDELEIPEPVKEPGINSQQKANLQEELGFIFASARDKFDAHLLAGDFDKGKLISYFEEVKDSVEDVVVKTYGGGLS